MLERVGKGVLKLGVLGEGKARAPLSFGVERDKALCDILCRAFRSRRRLVPFKTAHLRELDGAVLILLTNIFSEILKSVAGDEESVRARVAKLDIVFGYSVHRYGFNALEERDTVVGMDDVVTDCKVGVAHKARARASRLSEYSLTSAVLHYLATSVASHRQYGYLRHKKLVANRFSNGYEYTAALGGCDVNIAVGYEPHRKAVVVQRICKIFSARLTFGNDDRAVESAAQIV